MSDHADHWPVKSILPKWVRGPQIFVGGIALIAIAVFALWASSDFRHAWIFGFVAEQRLAFLRFCCLGMLLGYGRRYFNRRARTRDLPWRGPLFVSCRILHLPHDPPSGLVSFCVRHFMISALPRGNAGGTETIIVVYR